MLDTLASVLDATIDKADKDFEKMKVGFGIGEKDRQSAGGT